jgi:hypothetical protein
MNAEMYDLARLHRANRQLGRRARTGQQLEELNEVAD